MTLETRVSLAVVIPVYNSEATIRAVVDEVLNCLAHHDLEIVLVDDGSKDRSGELCAEIGAQHPQAKFIQLARNFGEHNAVLCGLNHCSKEWAAIIDDDLQNPPAEIEKLLAKGLEGFDVVYAAYAQKEHAAWRNLVSKINGATAALLIQKPAGLYLSSFKLIHRTMIDEIIKYRGPFPYIDGLLLRATNSIAVTHVAHAPRMEGRSNYTLWKLFALHLNMLVNFSVVPLRLCSMLGVVLLVIGMLFALIALLERLFNPALVPGWASVIITVSLLSGAQLLCLGILGEYVGKLYLDQNGTPQWVIRRRH